MSRVTVIGAGIIGLWTAEVLSSRGHRVTIRTSEPPAASCSASAACVITPLLPSEWTPQDQKFLTAWGRYRRTIAKFRSIDQDRSRKESFLEQMPSHECGFEENGERYLEKGFNIKRFKHLPFAKFETIQLDPPVRVQNHLHEYHMCSFCTKFVADFCNTEIFLKYLYEILINRGVNFEFAAVKTLDEITSLKADVIFNCMGFESPKIFPDDSLFYVRGQSMMIEAEGPAEGPYFGVASGHHAIFRHRKGFYLGSYFLEGNASSYVPNKAEFDLSIQFAKGPYKVLCTRLGFQVPSIDFNRIKRVNTGVRPFRPEGPRVEADEMLATRRCRPVKVIHNYGHGAHGWTLGYASAEDAVNIAEVRGWLD